MLISSNFLAFVETYSTEWQIYKLVTASKEKRNQWQWDWHSLSCYLGLCTVYISQYQTSQKYSLNTQGCLFRTPFLSEPFLLSFMAAQPFPSFSFYIRRRTYPVANTCHSVWVTYRCPNNLNQILGGIPLSLNCAHLRNTDGKLPSSSSSLKQTPAGWSSLIRNSGYRFQNGGCIAFRILLKSSETVRFNYAVSFPASFSWQKLVCF